MATSNGLELYQRLSKGQGLRYMGGRKHPTAWCIYSHESRIALLATGEGGLWLQVTHTRHSARHHDTNGYCTGCAECCHCCIQTISFIVGLTYYGNTWHDATLFRLWRSRLLIVDGAWSSLHL